MADDPRDIYVDKRGVAPVELDDAVTGRVDLTPLERQRAREQRDPIARIGHLEENHDQLRDDHAELRRDHNKLALAAAKNEGRLIELVGHARGSSSERTARRQRELDAARAKAVAEAQRLHAEAERAARRVALWRSFWRTLPKILGAMATAAAIVIAALAKAGC